MTRIIALFLLLSSAFSSMNAQDLSPDFFKKTDAFLKKHVQNGAVNYATVAKDDALNDLIQTIETASLQGLDKQSTQAFYINAYNLWVIKGAADNYPLNSVLDVSGFFDAKKRTVAGESITLNQLEKDKLLKNYGDPRFHFVLVCGAVGCPPITDFAYAPEKLEAQLEEQTQKALNDPNFIQLNAVEKQVNISQIFEWYSSDFGGNKKSALAFINDYRPSPISDDFKIGFYKYDWTLNHVGASGAANASRYVVSAAIPKGTTETKIFNNLYSQTIPLDGASGLRSSFFTTQLSFIYGLNNRFNLGFDLRYRRVANSRSEVSPFAVLGNPADAQTRQGFTTFGPKIRWAPVPKWENFSVQSAFWLPLGEELQGNSDQPYIDWDGYTWWTQLFNDFTLGSRFSLFTELDFFLEDIGKGDNNRFSTPVTAILSFFPNPKTTLYALSGFSPYWQRNFDYFAQAGVGAKYQFTPRFELELLYTGFTNQFLQQSDGSASTFNIGVRFNR